MIVDAAAAGYALFVWWFSTGIILLLDNLPRRTFRWSMSAGTAVFAVALWRLSQSAWDTSIAGAYAAFTYAILAWGWQEMSFFMGFVTGPRRTGCRPHATLAERFQDGVAACLYHELAILLTAAIIVGSTWGAPNQTGAWTFLLLWGARQSAKLNVFLGVRNLGERFVPIAPAVSLQLYGPAADEQAAAVLGHGRHRADGRAGAACRTARDRRGGGCVHHIPGHHAGFGGAGALDARAAVAI